MIKIITTLFLIAFSCVYAQDAKLVTWELHPDKVHTIETMTGVTTTIEFPDNIAAVEGQGLMTDPSKQSGQFLIAFEPGSRFLTVTPAAEKGNTNVNVIVGKRTYVLIFKVGVRFKYRVRFVPNGSFDIAKKILKMRDDTKRIEALMPGSPPEELSVLTPAKALSFLDKCRMFPLLKEYKPEAIKGITYRNNVGTIDEFPDYNIELLNVYRDNAMDILAFHVRFKSKKNHSHYYDLERFAITVGDSHYKQFTSTANGVVNPIGTTNEDDPRNEEAWFLVAGDGTGGRNDLAVTNRFHISVPQVQVLPASEDQTLPPFIEIDVNSGK